MGEIGEVNKTPATLCEFEWRIKDFISLKEHSYFSPYFSFDGASWNLLIFPYGEEEFDTVRYIKLCLFRTSGISPIGMEAFFCLKTSNGKKIVETHAKRHFIQGYEKIEIYGTHLALTRADLLEKQTVLLPSNVLTVLCTLKYSKPTEDASEGCTPGSSISQHSSKVLYDFKQLFLNKEDSDVIIKTKGQEFPEHKAILKIRSPVFASIFRHDIEVKLTGIVEIENCNASLFSDFLCFLYCGDVGIITHENVFNLFSVADKYHVQDLRTKCIEFMKNNLTIENFCNIFALAIRHSESELIKFTNNFFINNALKIISTAKWQSFVIQNIHMFKIK